jgi:hypothetical protein
VNALAEIKRIYYGTSAATIEGDLARAILLLKTMASEEERERAGVYMDGLREMRSEWATRRKAQPAPRAASRPRDR